MASLIFKAGSYYAVFSLGKRKLWKKIGKVEKKDARKVLKQLELEFTKDRFKLHGIKHITLTCPPIIGP